MTGLPLDVNPEDVALEMLKAELPGFESRIVPERNAIGIRGALPISTEVSRELIMYPLMHSTIFVDRGSRNLLDALEPDTMRAARHAQQREALKLELEPTISHITERVRAHAIEAVGLEKVIREREERAAKVGRRDGYAAGHDAGVAEGRRQVTLEWATAMQELRDGIGAWPEVSDDE